MYQFLFCSTVFGKKQYTVLSYEKNEVLVYKLNYLLTHRKDAVIWPLFTRYDVRECLPMDVTLSSLLRGLIVGSENCKIKYNGEIYNVDEIVISTEIERYWAIHTDLGYISIDPEYVEFA